MQKVTDILTLSLTGSDVKKMDIPEGSRPRSEIDSVTGGFVVSEPFPDGNSPGAEAILRSFNLDPAEWRVTSSRKSRWQRWDTEWLESERVNIVPMGYSEIPNFDLEKLLEGIAKWKPSGKVNDDGGSLTGVYSTGDTQYGKDDTPAIIAHMLKGIDESVYHHKQLAKKYSFEQIALPSLGDCVEGTVSQKGAVMGRHDIGIARQVTVAIRVELAFIKAMAPLAPKIIVPRVGGNHDETQRLLVGEPGDSWSITIGAAVEDICKENEFLRDRVEFRYPNMDDSTLAIDLSGSLYGMAHGHQGRDMKKWWEGQSMGRCAVANADILNVGHLHHYDVKNIGPKLFIQNPAMDGGSSWFRDKRGLESPPGIVSLVVGEGFDPRRELVVLAGIR